MLLPNHHVWNAASWVVRGFFDDAMLVVTESTPLAERIRSCAEAGLDALDLRDADRATLDELARILDAVIGFNDRMQGSNFHDPSGFAVYRSKLAELRELIDRAS